MKKSYVAAKICFHAFYEDIICVSEMDNFVNDMDWENAGGYLQ